MESYCWIPFPDWPRQDIEICEISQFLVPFDPPHHFIVPMTAAEVDSALWNPQGTRDNRTMPGPVAEIADIVSSHGCGFNLLKCCNALTA